MVKIYLCTPLTSLYFAMAAQVARVAITPKNSRYFTRAMVVAVAVLQTIYTKYVCMYSTVSNDVVTIMHDWYTFNAMIERTTYCVHIGINRQYLCHKLFCYIHILFVTLVIVFKTYGCEIILNKYSSVRNVYFINGFLFQTTTHRI